MLLNDFLKYCDKGVFVTVIFPMYGSFFDVTNTKEFFLRDEAKDLVSREIYSVSHCETGIIVKVM